MSVCLYDIARPAQDDRLSDGHSRSTITSHDYVSHLYEDPVKGRKLVLESHIILLRMACVPSELRGLGGDSFIGGCLPGHSTQSVSPK